MEHEVVVPMPAGQVRQALQDPALLARSVPGLSTEPAAVGSGPAEEIGGRLKLRIGTSTITYKGVLSLIEGREGVLTAFAEGRGARQRRGDRHPPDQRRRGRRGGHRGGALHR